MGVGAESREGWGASLLGWGRPYPEPFQAWVLLQLPECHGVCLSPLIFDPVPALNRPLHPQVTDYSSLLQPGRPLILVSSLVLLGAIPLSRGSGHHCGR